MKGVLLDENLPARIMLPTDLPVRHVSSLGTGMEDSAIWDHARCEHLVVVTKDADFSYRIAGGDPPPWVVHVRVGNLRLRDFRTLLEEAWPRVEERVRAAKLVNLYVDRIEVIT